MIGPDLKVALKAAGIPQAQFARTLGISPTALSFIIKHDIWPKKNTAEAQQRIRQFLLDNGANPKAVNEAMPKSKTVAKKGAKAKTPRATKKPTQQKDKGFYMIRKQILTPEAKRQFGLYREIFTDVLTSEKDVYLTPEMRYVRECLYQTARHGGLLALYGQSGSGKTTLRRELVERLKNDPGQTIVIEPYVLGMEGESNKVTGLRSVHLSEAIMAAVSPSFTPQGTPERRFRNMHKLLKESSEANNRHVVIIEEAHSLPITTIKHLKRFYELENGFTRLLSIILIGQNELKNKLSETDAAVREVVQRMELLELRPLDDLEGYVRHRCKRAEADFEAIFDKDAMPALHQHLTGPAQKNGSVGEPLHYPLLVGNTLTKAMNKAAELGLPRVTADAIKSA